MTAPNTEGTMSEVIETLGQLVGVAGDGFSDAQIHWLDQTETLGLVRAALRAFPQLLGSGIAGDVAYAFKQVLAIRLGDVLVAVWNTRMDLVKFLDRKKYPPGEVSELVLGEQRFSRTLTPRIEILVNGQRLPEVKIDIKVDLTIEAAVLRIKDGRIMSARTGTCEGKVTLSCGKAILPSPGARSFKLPGTISFGEGIPIRDLTISGQE